MHHAPRIVGPSENISAVIINPNQGTGLAKIIYKGREYATLHTNSNGEDEAVMIFLQPGFYCVLKGNTRVKYIEGGKIQSQDLKIWATTIGLGFSDLLFFSWG